MTKFMKRLTVIIRSGEYPEGFQPMLDYRNKDLLKFPRMLVEQLTHTRRQHFTMVRTA